MPAVARALALVTTTTLAALAIAPITGASAAAIGAPDGLTPKPVTAAKRHGPVKARAAQASATDPRITEQWPLQGDAPMGIDSAWRQTTGADVPVAIIDSGIDLGHPDLAPNLWTNPGELPGNGIDDDGNGYVDDVHGYDFVDNDGTPQDTNGHGTHVAGIVGARGDNGIGVAGVAWQARLMTIRVLDGQARGTTAAVAAGLRYAVDNGARIVNLSLAGPTSTPDLEAAVHYARARGVPIVVAVGNDGADLAAAPTYPAAYGDDNVLGVAATTRDGGLSSVSDYGPGADVAAPGEQILATALGGSYEWRTGTSMAAPEVTGALVLLAAARPDLDGNGLRDALLAGVRHTGLPVSAGALDVGVALRGVIDPDDWIEEPVEHLSDYTTPVVRSTAKSKAKKSTPKSTTAKKKTKVKRKATPKRKATSKAARKKAAQARARAKARKAAARAKARKAAAARHRAKQRGARR